MPTSLDLEQELQRALQVIERQSRIIESLTALLSQTDADDDEHEPEQPSGYLNSRG